MTVALVAILGLTVGSFLNVAIYRFASGKGTLIAPASHCPHCNHAIRWHDNIPLLGWLICRGHCRDCQQPIHWQYPLIEALTALMAIAVVQRFGLGLPAYSAWLISAWLIVLAGIDWHTRLLPDGLTLSGLWMGLVIAPWAIHVSPSHAIFGAALGYSSLWALNASYRHYAGHDGMGGGDFKLLALIGAWVGAQGLPLVLLLAAGGGSIWAIAGLISGTRGRYDTLAFGPWLAVGGWITLLWGHAIALP